MPVRSAYPGTALTGEVLTALKVNNLPGGWIGYAEAPADQSGVVNPIDLTGMLVNVTVGASRRLRIEVCTSILSNVAADSAALGILESTTVLATRSIVVVKANTLEGLTCTAIITPTAGAHTFRATLERSTGTGTFLSGSGPGQRAYIYVEDIGPA